VTGTDAIIGRILTAYDTITVVGASAAPAKAAHFVPAHMQRHGWRIIPVNPHADAILGEHVYRRLGDVHSARVRWCFSPCLLCFRA
jgi:predicted CoA-binding protein